MELSRHQQLKEAADLNWGQKTNKRIHQTRENYTKDEKAHLEKHRAIHKHCNPKDQKLLIRRYCGGFKLTAFTYTRF